MKILVVSLMVILIVSSAQAQYKTYKNKYDVKDYKYQSTDRYNPTAAGLLAIVPGLGHCYVGEPLKGLGFFALSYGSVILTTYGISQAWKPGHTENVGWMVGGGAAMFVGSYIWSIADVTRVAKIKSMHLREKNITLHLYPSFQSTVQKRASMGNIPGATFTINF